MSKKWPKVSVVISNYNGLKLNILIESLSSILKNSYPELEIILMDNSSTDGSVAGVRKRFGKNPKLQIIENMTNTYSQGLNLGVKNSLGDYVAFFNNDVVVNNGYFQKLVTYLDKNPDIVLIQGKLLSYYDHTIIDSAGETMDVFGSPITIGGHQKDGEKFNQISEVLSVSGSCSVLRKSITDKIGFFDQDYGIGFEDLDLALRARLSGYKVVYFPEVEALHRRGVTDLSQEIRVKVRWDFNKNRLITMLKNFSPGLLIRGMPVTILIYIAAGLWEMLIKKKPKLGLTRFTAVIWVLLNLPAIIRKRQKIQKKANKKGAKMIESLFYKDTLKQGFLSFIKVK